MISSPVYSLAREIFIRELTRTHAIEASDHHSFLDFFSADPAQLRLLAERSFLGAEAFERYGEELRQKAGPPPRPPPTT